jgi:transposase InsO family protein
MDQRVRFIAAFESLQYTMTELCWEFGISRKTGYKWVSRYREEGVDGLKDRSRAPKSCPHRTAGRCERALIEERQKHPHWGPRKLLVVLERRHPPPSKPVIEAREPNDLWSADFKGEFRTGDRRLCFPLTVADQRSRYLLGCEGKRSTAIKGVRDTFELLFAEYGLPDKLLTDGGLPFASGNSVRRLSKLSVWWIRLGIEPLLTEPGHPEQNGRHERMHRTLKAATARPPASSLKAQQRAFDRFRQEYNHERPHESLDMRPPAELYTPSNRPYPQEVPVVDYPGHYEMRTVGAKGVINWRGRKIFVSESLHGEQVGLEEIDEGLWSLYFGPLLLGRYDERARSLELL